MASWATKRKLAYISIITVLAAVFVALPLYLSYYKAPSCSDRIQNQGELGIDCGGPCARLCQSAFLPPEVSWTKFEKVSEGIYNLGAYIINPNINGAVVAASYKFSLFDRDGILITEVPGTTIIPSHRNTLAFAASVSTQKRPVVRAIFEFTQPPLWQKSFDSLGGISIIDKKYSEDKDGSSLEVFIQNNILLAYNKIRLGAILYDDSDNAVGFSSTVIDAIAPGKKELAVFTWPLSRKGKVASIEILPVATPILSR
ncbi:hypothetical protein EB052_00630 [bacterium]|nr:hypothetical protein [bacterium]